MRFQAIRRLCVLAVIASAGWPHVSAAADLNWPQFRGPEGQGIVRDKGLALEWSDKKNVLWKTALPGLGYSSPIVWGDRLFVTTAEGAVVPGEPRMKHVIGGLDFTHPQGVGADRRHSFQVLALSATTGRILWRRTAWERPPADTRDEGRRLAAPTPVTDGRLVYAYFGTEGLYAYDFDGTLAWHFTPGLLSLGSVVGTSPLLYKDLVILLCDEDSGDKSYVVGLDKKTGKEVWRTPRKIRMSWATPVIVRAEGRDELVTSGAEAIIAYDPATGKERWRMKGLESDAIPSPVAGNGVVVLSTGHPAKLVVAVRPGGSGDVTGSRVLWRYTKGTGHVPSPILYDGYVYLMTDKGLLTCLDVKTGEVKYEGGRPPVPGTFRASPIAVAGKLLLMSTDGDTFVVKAGPRHEVLSTNSLGEPIHASAAVANGRIYIRGEKHLFAVAATS